MTDRPGAGRTEAIEILLVEDNPGDVRLVREAVGATDRETSVRAVTSGDDAVEFLTDRAADDSLPDLVVVDLNLPGASGYEVLETIAGDERLAPLPAIVLTSSTDTEAVKRSYDAHANAYVTKPSDPDEFEALVEALEAFWFDRVQLPPVPP